MWNNNRAPEQWNTQEILEWILGNDDSHGEIKNRIMSIVQTNDLDGHTLKQLAAEKDEIQSLFPSLKERLAFKSMLRKLFKNEYQASSQTDQPACVPKVSPACQQRQPQPQPQPPPGVSQSYHGAGNGGFTSPLPQVQVPSRFSHSQIQFSPKDAPGLMPIQQQPSQPALYHQARGEPSHQPLEKKPRLSFDRTAQPAAPPPPVVMTVFSLEKNQSPVTTVSRSDRLDSNDGECWNPSQTSLTASAAGTLEEYRTLQEMGHIDYPAPLPEFSDELRALMRSSAGDISLAVRKLMVRESAKFYVKHTLGQRLNTGGYANIGRTMVEKYPGLACDEDSPPWTQFIKSLSQSIRNFRRRLKIRRQQALEREEDEAEDDLNDISDDAEDADGNDGESYVYYIKEESPR